VVSAGAARARAAPHTETHVADALVTDTELITHFNFLTRDDYHAIRESSRDLFTLFIQGPNVQDWGFLVAPEGDVAKHWPHADYFEAKKLGEVS
jgi:hypothetical protein